MGFEGIGAHFAAIPAGDKEFNREWGRCWWREIQFLTTDCTDGSPDQCIGHKRLKKLRNPESGSIPEYFEPLVAISIRGIRAIRG
jgi:hypothetical protein